jgi:hypothetical protein
MTLSLPLSLSPSSSVNPMKGPVRDSSTFTFNATAKTVTFSAPIPSSQQQILAVLNVTRNAWLYLPTKAAYGGTWASPTLTLTASTTGHANGDVLQIIVDDGLTTTAVAPNVTRGAGNADADTQRVTLAADGPAVTALTSLDSDLGLKTDTAATDDTGTWSIIGLFKRLLGHVAGFRTISTTGTLAALNDTVTLNLNGQTQAYIGLSGTWAGTITFELQTDTGWVSANSVTPGATSTGSISTTTTSNTTRTLSCAGCAGVRVSATAWTSGTASITLRAGQGSGMSPVGIVGTATVQGSTSRAGTISPNLTAICYRGATAAPTAVTNGQGVDQLATTYGVAIVRPWSIPELCWLYAAASGGITNTTDVAIASAAGAGLRRYLVRLTLSNNSATATEVVVKDGSTVIARLHMAANTGNVPFMFDPPLSTTANAALNVACITTGAAVYANAQGFTAP